MHCRVRQSRDLEWGKSPSRDVCLSASNKFHHLLYNAARLSATLIWLCLEHTINVHQVEWIAHVTLLTKHAKHALLLGLEEDGLPSFNASTKPRKLEDEQPKSCPDWPRQHLYRLDVSAVPAEPYIIGLVASNLKAVACKSTMTNAEGLSEGNAQLAAACRLIRCSEYVKGLFKSFKRPQSGTVMGCFARS